MRGGPNPIGRASLEEETRPGQRDVHVKTREKVAMDKPSTEASEEFSLASTLIFDTQFLKLRKQVSAV